MLRSILVVLIVTTLIFPFSNVLVSQSEDDTEKIIVTPDDDRTKDATDVDSKQNILDEYLGIKLGETRDVVLEKVEKHLILNIDKKTYFGDFDAEQKYIIKARKVPVLHSVYLQFIPSADYLSKEIEDDKNWKLYMIIIDFNTKYNDFNKICSMLTYKYGEPDLRNPDKAIWKPRGNDTKLVLNKPCKLKIYNVKDFEIASKKYKNYSTLSEKTHIKDVLNPKILKDFE